MTLAHLMRLRRSRTVQYYVLHVLLVFFLLLVQARVRSVVLGGLAAILLIAVGLWTGTLIQHFVAQQDKQEKQDHKDDSQ